MKITQEEAVLKSMIHWRNGNAKELVNFAIARHGYGDTDGGFGVTYWSDLDEHDREVDGYFIPEGSLEVYGFWGAPDGYKIIVEEKFYLNCLFSFLINNGYSELAEQISQFSTNIFG